MYNLLEEINKVVNERKTHNDFEQYYSYEQNMSKLLRDQLSEHTDTESSEQNIDNIHNEYQELFENISLKNVNVDNLILDNHETLQYLV